VSPKRAKPISSATVKGLLASCADQAVTLILKSVTAMAPNDVQILLLKSITILPKFPVG
jgi:hypothetical protein